jgi:ABC-2 type transport system ATP-binding protein
VTVIHTERLSRWYGEVIGLNDVTVDVGEGITGLLGKNGAGKSSLIRILSGEIRPSSGAARLLGEKPFANPKLSRRVGYCPEGDRFFDGMRCQPFLVHLLRLSGYPRAEAGLRADRALEDVDLLSASRVRLGACSKGMRQRVKIAQAIAHDPEVLLLDEPLSGLDPVARRLVIGLFRRRAEAGSSVLISSHVLAEIEALTDRILLINHGRIAASGTVREIRSEIGTQPYRIVLKCEEPRRLAAALVTQEDVLSLRLEDHLVHVETNAPETFHSALPALLAERRIAVTGIASPDDRLEAVFALLTGGRR